MCLYLIFKRWPLLFSKFLLFFLDLLSRNNLYINDTKVKSALYIYISKECIKTFDYLLRVSYNYGWVWTKKKRATRMSRKCCLKNLKSRYYPRGLILISATASAVNTLHINQNKSFPSSSFEFSYFSKMKSIFVSEKFTLISLRLP